MFNRYLQIQTIAFEYVSLAQYRLSNVMAHQSVLERDFGQVVRDKTPDHQAYKVDDFSDDLLFEVLRNYQGVGWQIFTEEKGWIRPNGKVDFKIICDPFCNTSLAMRSFRESAVAVCIVDGQNRFVSCAIADLNVARIFYADTEETKMYSFEDGRWQAKTMHVSSTQNLSEAFVVVSALKQSRREWLFTKRLFLEAGQFHSLDGAIFIGRLSSGYIDAYLDPSVGQPLYEVPCLEMIKRAGGIVKNTAGEDFNLSQIVTGLETNPKYRFSFVATATRKLYDEIIASL